MRHTEKLVENGGTLIDLITWPRNRHHVYADAGLVVMRGSLAAGVAQSNESVAQRNATVAQSKLNKLFHKDFNKRIYTWENSKTKIPQSLEWMIAGGASEEEIAILLENEKKVKLICDTYEQSMGYNPLPWSKMDRLKKFLLTKTVEEIQAFAAWSLGKYSGLSPTKARQNPDMVIDLWPQAFIHPQESKPQPYTEPKEAEYVTR